MPDGVVNENALGNASPRSSGGYHPPAEEGDDASAETVAKASIAHRDEHGIAQLAACIDPSPRARRLGIAHVYQMHYRFG
jgi:hypothetical protein